MRRKEITKYSKEGKPDDDEKEGTRKSRRDSAPLLLLKDRHVDIQTGNCSEEAITIAEPRSDCPLEGWITVSVYGGKPIAGTVPYSFR